VGEIGGDVCLALKMSLKTNEMMMMRET